MTGRPPPWVRLGPESPAHPWQWWLEAAVGVASGTVSGHRGRGTVAACGARPAALCALQEASGQVALPPLTRAASIRPCANQRENRRGRARSTAAMVSPGHTAADDPARGCVSGSSASAKRCERGSGGPRGLDLESVAGAGGARWGRGPCARSSVCLCPVSALGASRHRVPWPVLGTLPALRDSPHFSVSRRSRSGAEHEPLTSPISVDT